MRITNILSSSPVKSTAKIDPTSPPTPTTPVRKGPPDILATPNSSPRRRAGASGSSLFKQSLNSNIPRIQRDSHDRWIRYANVTEGSEDTLRALELSGTDNTSSEDTLQFPRTAKAILMEGISTGPLSLKRKRIESDGDEEHVRKRIRRVMEPLAVQFNVEPSIISTQRSEDAIQTAGGKAAIVELMEQPGYGLAPPRNTLPHDEEIDAQGKNEMPHYDNSHLVADVTFPVESAEALYDESFWALHLYHAHCARGDKPELIKQAQKRLIAAQESWNKRADNLVREGQYDLVQEILARNETSSVADFDWGLFSTC
ncbi:hypothetical protein FRC17_009889 [Serendipita sp. 399]|nr:hypothetical protein FRC17_009889 [Serendipita sp. 399]